MNRDVSQNPGSHHPHRDVCDKCGNVHDNLHVSWARKDREYRRIIFCPTCKRRRRFYVWSQDWYGAIATCCHCGDAWGDGERMERPFKRGWREESARKARRDYASVVSGRPDRGGD